jgi:flagellar hook-associated protein FlgK
VTDALNIAASGLQAAQAQMAVTANNIANVNTPGYTAQRVELAGTPLGGVAVTGVQSTNEGDNLTNELVNLDRQTLYYDANGMVIRTSDQIYGSLLNILDTDNQSNWDHNQDS